MGRERPLRVLVVEDEVTVRRGLERLLAADARFTVVGSCDDAASALALIERRVEAEAALVDLGLPDRTGLDVIIELRRAMPRTSVVVLSQLEDDDSLFGALEAGAVGYLLKSTPLERLLPLLVEAIDGGAPLSPGLARRVIARFAAPVPDQVKLTPRELDTLRGLCRGESYAQVASHLGVTLGTVQTYVKAVYQKLEVRSKAEATRVALAKQIVK